MRNRKLQYALDPYISKTGIRHLFGLSPAKAEELFTECHALDRARFKPYETKVPTDLVFRHLNISRKAFIKILESEEK